MRTTFGRERAAWTLLALGTGAIATVLLALPLLPFLDLPNHAARLHLIAALPEDPFQARFWTVEWRLLPNVAIDAAWLAVADLMAPGTFLALVLALAAAMLSAGTALVRLRLFGAISPLAALAPVAFIALPLKWGFVSFTLSIALAVLCLGLWLSLPRRGWAAIAFGNLAGALLFFVHGLGLGLFGLALGSVAIGEAMAAPRGARSRVLGFGLLRAAAASIVPLALAVGHLSADATTNGGIVYFDMLGKIAIFLMRYDRYTFLADLGLFLLVAFAARAALSKGRAPIDGRLAVVSVAPIALFLFGPSIIGESAMLDVRMPAAAAAFALCGLRAPDAAPRGDTVLLGAVAAILAAGTVSNAAFWRGHAAIHAEVRTRLSDLPAGTRLAVWPARAAFDVGGRSGLIHAGTYAVTAAGAYVPSVFAKESQQVLRPLPGVRADPRLGPDFGTDPGAIDWGALARTYDRLAIVASWGDAPCAAPEIAAAGWRATLVTPHLVLLQPGAGTPPAPEMDCADWRRWRTTIAG